MKIKLNSVMLLDDNEASNFIHGKFIDQAECTNKIVKFQSGFNAINYLKDEANLLPELIFIDINMPEMSGWEFLNRMKNIDRISKQVPVVVLLSTSLSPEDVLLADKSKFIRARRLKPLSVIDIKLLINEFFPIKLNISK